MEEVKQETEVQRKATSAKGVHSTSGSCPTRQAPNQVVNDMYNYTLNTHDNLSQPLLRGNYIANIANTSQPLLRGDYKANMANSSQLLLMGDYLANIANIFLQ